MSRSGADVLIVGAGVIGCALARELAGRGAKAGINLRLEGAKIFFEHTPLLVAAVKRR